MGELNNIKDIVTLVSRMQNLCEGFDETNKTALISIKLKILLELTTKEKVTPSQLKLRVGLAKSNLALTCNSMIKEGLIEKIKDNFDNRSIFYSITEHGKKVLEQNLTRMQKNFSGELAYKNNMKQINNTVKELLELVN